MITEDYVSFETAKLLKEKGFGDDFCHTAYDCNGEFFWYGDYSKDRKGVMDAPTLQMAMKWLREEYHIFIRVIQSHIEHCVCEIYYNSSSCYTFRTSFDSYEEACEEAIKYCLEKLI